MSIMIAKKAWNATGTLLKPGITTDEVIATPVINYLVGKEPVYTDDKIVIPRHYAMMRDTPRVPLGITGKVYKVVQNHQSIRLVDAVLQGKAIWHAVNAIGDGEAMWALARMPDPIEITPGEKVIKFVLLITRHDGQASLSMGLCPINEKTGVTYNMDFNASARKKTRARHTTGVIEKLEDVELFMRDAIDSFDLFESKAKQLAEKQIDSKMLEQYFHLMVKMVYRNPEAKKTAQRVGDLQSLLKNLFTTSAAGTTGSAWNAFNAVAEYADFYKPTRKMNGHSEDTQRTKAILYGDIRKYKQMAFDTIVQMAGV